MGRYDGCMFVCCILLISTLVIVNLEAEAKVTVHSVTVTTDKAEYTLGSEAVAKAQLDYTGSKKDLLGVNFTWHYPNGTIAKFAPDVMPDGSGAAYSSLWPSEIGVGFVVNATYTGDPTIYDEITFDVKSAPPSDFVSGPINIDTVWTLGQSPYIVAGDVFVQIGVTLTIEPGVVVEFHNDTVLVINGTLVSEGNRSNMITFTSSNSEPNPGDWVGIDFNYADPGSSVTSCRIEYANIGINIFDSSPTIENNLIRDISRTGIQAYRSNSHISNNTITNIAFDYASNKGINLISQCSVIIENNTISNVEEYGIRVLDSEPVIRFNSISGSIYNIECTGSNATIMNNSLYDAVDSIRLISCENILIENNEIFGNLKYGIRSEQSSPRIISNYIYENGESGIWFYLCSGGEIAGNVFSYNYRGMYVDRSFGFTVSDNQITNSTKEGFFSETSDDFDIWGNTFKIGEAGIYLKDCSNISIAENDISDNGQKGLFLYNSTKIKMVANVISNNDIGVFLQSSQVDLTNCTLNGNTFMDIQLAQSSYMISINSSFGENKVIVPGGCTLVVKNYLHVFVQNGTYAPHKQASLCVKDGDTTIYSVHTDDLGYATYLAIIDRIYNESNVASENETTLEVIDGSQFLLYNPRSVDMSYSHLEVFGPGNPLDIAIDTPGNGSLVFDDLNITGSAGNQGSENITLEIKLDEGEWMQVNFTGDDRSSWWLSYDTKSLSDGDHMIFARITSDLYYNEVSRTIVVDNIGNKPPVVQITSHHHNDAVNGTISIKGSVYDYDGIVDSVLVRIDSGILIDAEMTDGNVSSWSLTIDTKEFQNGTHKITVIAFDNASDSSTVSIDLLFVNENGGPSGEGKNPERESEDGSFNWWILIIILLVIVTVLMVILKKKHGQEEKEENQGHTK